MKKKVGVGGYILCEVKENVDKWQLCPPKKNNNKQTNKQQKHKQNNQQQAS